MQERRKIKWVIAHLPEYLFVRTAEAFQKQLEEHMPGKFDVEIIRGATTYVEKYNKHHNIANLDQLHTEFKPGYDALFEAMDEGDIEMAQLQVSDLARFEHNYDALNLPYLFDDHDHVSRALDGEIGRGLCESLAEKSGVRGLAFTYSGGYRVIGANTPIKTLEDVKALKIATNKCVLQETLNELGADTAYMSAYTFKQNNVPNETVPAIESTYLRFTDNVKHILKTNHNMFLTNIIMSKKFWNTLTKEEQQAIQVAALAVAKEERQWSIDDAELFEKTAAEKGIEIVEISDEDTRTFKAVARRVYAKLAPTFTDNIVLRIKKS